jgi:hypothetical protein
MSTTNDSAMYNLGILAFALNDNNSANSTTQATATPIIGEIFRVLQSVASGIVLLKSILTKEAPPVVFVLNDSPNTIIANCWPGEKLNGVTNGTLSIASGAFGFFMQVPTQIARGGGGGGTLDWRAAVVT